MANCFTSRTIWPLLLWFKEKKINRFIHAFFVYSMFSAVSGVAPPLLPAHCWLVVPTPLVPSRSLICSRLRGRSLSSHGWLQDFCARWLTQKLQNQFLSVEWLKLSHYCPKPTESSSPLETVWMTCPLSNMQDLNSWVWYPTTWNCRITHPIDDGEVLKWRRVFLLCLQFSAENTCCNFSDFENLQKFIVAKLWSYFLQTFLSS